MTDRETEPGLDRANVVFLTVGPKRDLIPVKPHKLWSVWAGQGKASGLNPHPDQDLTVVTVLRRGLQVLAAFVMRLPVSDTAHVTPKAVSRACRDADEAMRAKPGRRAKRLADALAYHAELLPADHRTQLGVYLDCPAAHFDELEIGGPLPLARIGRMSVEEVVKHLAEES